MSKRRFRTQTGDGTPVEVIAGWDPPLERLFLVVNRIKDGEDVETLFSNLDWPHGPKMDLWEISGVLSVLGVPFPSEWFRDVARDKRAETGNEVSDYGRFITGHHPPFDINSDNHRP